MAACSQDEVVEIPGGDTGGAVPAVMNVTLPDAEAEWSRHTVDNSTDSWTTKSFSMGDKIGLFSTGGLVDSNGESQWILNEHMDYDQATGSTNYRFRNDALLINTSLMGGKVGKYVYFPYCEDMPLPVPGLCVTNQTTGDETYYGEGKSNASQMTTHPGMYLRVSGTDYKDRPIDRCVDYMYINNISLTNGALGGGFYHGFTEMIIVRGEGFDECPDEYVDEITVVLNNGYTRMRLNAFRENATGNFSFRPQNYFWPADEADKGITQEEAKRWKAWKGVEYVDVDKFTGESVFRDAWYVILPTAHSYSYPSVTYIEIYNNEGKMQKVTNFDLYVDPKTGVADKLMRPGYRYAVEVMMVEGDATVRPHSITDWNEGLNGENDITDVREAGINDYEDFSQWQRLYNHFVTNINSGSWERPKKTEDITGNEDYKKLAQYGDYDLNNGTWRFYINDKIEIPAGAPVFINELQDILEGASQFANIPVKNLKGTLIGAITDKGELRYLDFDNLYVKLVTNGNGTAGALVNHLNGGKLRRCNVNNGTVVGSDAGTVGMLCGTVSGAATITDCKVSGAVIGTAWGNAVYPEGLFGSVGGTPTYSNIDASGLIVKSN